MRTKDISFKIIRVNVTPTNRSLINKSDLSVLTNELFYVPAHTVHILQTVTCLISDNLNVGQTKKIYTLVSINADVGSMTVLKGIFRKQN